MRIHEVQALVMPAMFVVFAVTALTITPSIAQETTGEAGHGGVDEAEMMRRWQEATTPGAGHEFLEQVVGSWEMRTKMWMGGPESEPVETTGSSEIKWILEGHYILQESTGSMMGKEHLGHGITGYDNYKKKYVGVWIDNLSTAIYPMEGFLDQTGTVLSMYGAMDEYMTGEHDRMVRYVTRIIDADHHVFEVYDLHGGTDFKVVEVAYTRVK